MPGYGPESVVINDILGIMRRLGLPLERLSECGELFKMFERELELSIDSHSRKAHELFRRITLAAIENYDGQRGRELQAAGQLVGLTELSEHDVVALLNDPSETSGLSKTVKQQRYKSRQVRLYLAGTKLVPPVGIRQARNLEAEFAKVLADSLYDFLDKHLEDARAIASSLGFVVPTQSQFNASLDTEGSRSATKSDDSQRSVDQLSEITNGSTISTIEQAASNSEVNLEPSTVGVDASQKSTYKSDSTPQVFDKPRTENQINPMTPDVGTTSFPHIRELHLDGWYWSNLKVSVTVAGFDSYEVMEDHTIIASRDGLKFLGLIVEGLPDLHGNVQFFADINRDPGTQFVARQPISRSCVHDLYELRHFLSPGQHYGLQIDRRVRRVATTAYAFSPVNRCNEFEIEVEFARHWIDKLYGVSLEVGCIDGLPPLVVRDHIDEYYTCTRSWDYRMSQLERFCWLVTPHDEKDRLIYKAKFQNLRPGLSYGILWDWVCSDDSNDSFAKFVEQMKAMDPQRYDMESKEISRRPLSRRIRQKWAK